MMISNIRENGEPIGALPDGEMMFHHDMIHSEMPDKATLLYSVESAPLHNAVFDQAEKKEFVYVMGFAASETHLTGCLASKTRQR